MGAQASTIVTYQGIISQGTDQTGVFGNSQQNLSGFSFSLKFTINNSQNPHSYLILSNGSTIFPQYQPVRYPRVGSGWYGRDYGELAPMISQLTINNKTVRILGQRGGQVDHLGPNSAQSLVHHRTEDLLVVTGAVDEAVIFDVFMNSKSDRFTNSWDYRNPLFHSVQFDDVVGGYFQYIGYTCATSCLLFNANGSFLPKSILIERGVPEPATWLVMLVGLGAVGLVLRRQRQRARTFTIAA